MEGLTTMNLPDKEGQTAAIYLERLAKIHSAGVEAIVARGEVLIEAKAHFDHGEWQTLCAGLPFSQRHAHRLRAIAPHKTLANRTFMSSLPDSLVVLYVLSTLSPAVVEAALADGRVHPHMSIKDARRLAQGEAATDYAGARAGGFHRKLTPWTLAGALAKIDRAIAGAPAAEFQALADGLHDRAQMLERQSGGPRRSGRTGERLRDDLAVAVLEVITSGYRAAARKHHPDAGGDVTAMAHVNAAMEWLRAQVKGLGQR
jgi:hypothetical protein